MPVPIQRTDFIITMFLCLRAYEFGWMGICLVWLVCLCDPPAGAHGFGQYHTSGVDSLEDALQVDPSGDLSDQDWGYPLGAQLLVDAQEVDLHHLLIPK
jgi:hypothetical protein